MVCATRVAHVTEQSCNSICVSTVHHDEVHGLRSWKCTSVLCVICSCKHGGLVSMNGVLGSGKLDVLDEGTLDGSPDGGRVQAASGWQLKCSRGISVVAVCLLLTLGSFAVPKSGHGLGSVKVSVSTPVHKTNALSG